MNEDLILKQFFSQEFERSANKSFNFEAVKQYINDVCAISYGTYIDYVIANPINERILTTHLTQSSSFESCTKKVCEGFEAASYRGLSFTDAGFFIHNDNVERTRNTLNRYGRDQVLTAKQFGLTFCDLKGCWHLSCIGRLFLSLSEDKQQAIMARCLLRDPLYSKIVAEVVEHDVYLSDYAEMFLESDNTMKRRLSSMMMVASVISAEATKECNNKLHNINQKRNV